MDTIKITYDNLGNTLDIWFTKPTNDIICDDLENEMIVKRDKSGNILGIEVLNYVKNKQTNVESLPVELSLIHR
ncbi:MAG: hypothetical protein A2275_12580 [Bacteroidetes bacterium RIFOXYA12_FULL_35_11]|nr:MAG: hypothetical protein A2X01_12390 [Bacteroidetes bacterium GWF2_35_48]OFY79233.1 MAG: hypothetical protein A2275_12580 [Bacteroidetes bacterium RIFOXYA12_FULL_35_11]OFY96420.1 MAG: hypothetical protein A2309_12350 [Bacteroidetes bacterium RIFOXYB2_FULL_35_7]